MVKLLSKIITGFIWFVSFITNFFTNPNSSRNRSQEILKVNSQESNHSNKDINSIFSLEEQLVTAVKEHLEDKVKFLLTQKKKNINFKYFLYIDNFPGIWTRLNGSHLLDLAVENALKKSDQRILKLLLDHDEFIAQLREKEEKKILLFAVENILEKMILGEETLKIIELLIDKGADVTIKNDNCETVFDKVLDAYYTTKKSYHKKLNLIDKNFFRDNKKSASNIAAKERNKKLARLLIDKGANLNAIPYSLMRLYFTTPLHFAAKEGYEDIIRYLIDEKGADINAKNHYQYTALHFAAKKGYKDIILYLIHKNADIEAGNETIGTPLHFAVKKGREDIVRCLIDEKGVNINAQNMYKSTVLHVAAQEGHEVIVRYLIDEKGADINVQNMHKNTALHFAAQKGHEGIVRYLVDEKNADINAENEDKNTALHFAVQEGYERIVRYLIDEKNADINAQNEDKNTALHFAAQAGHEGIVRYLIDKKNADINAQNAYKNTPLHFAAQAGYEGIVSYLLEQKSTNINAKNRDKNTPLHFAAQAGHEGIIRYLIDRGANIDCVNKDMMTPLHIVTKASTGHDKIIRYLLEKGANLKTLSRKKNTALDYLFKKKSYINSSLLEMILSSGEDINSKILLKRLLKFCPKILDEMEIDVGDVGDKVFNRSMDVTSRVNFLIENCPELVLHILKINFKENFHHQVDAQPDPNAVSSENFILFLRMAKEAFINSAYTLDKVLRFIYAKKLLRRFQSKFGSVMEKMSLMDEKIDLNLISPKLLENMRQYVLSLCKNPRFCESDAIQTLKKSIEKESFDFISQICIYVANHLPICSEQETLKPTRIKSEKKYSINESSPLDFQLFLLALNKDDLSYTKAKYEQQYMFNLLAIIKNFYEHLESIIHSQGELTINEKLNLNHKKNIFSGKDFLYLSSEFKIQLEEFENVLQKIK